MEIKFAIRFFYVIFINSLKMSCIYTLYIVYVQPQLCPQLLPGVPPLHAPSQLHVLFFFCIINQIQFEMPIEGFDYYSMTNCFIFIYFHI